MTSIKLAPLDKNETSSLSQKVAEAILRGAVEGRIAPGQRLTEVELAREFDVSRVPVREALRFLEGRGVVETAQRETRLFSSNDEKLVELINARKLLQGAVVADAIWSCHINRDQLYGFEDALDAMRRHSRRKDPYALATATLSFHRHMFIAAGNQTLLQMFDSIGPKIMIVLGLSFYTDPQSRIIVVHEKLMDMIRNNEITAAAAYIGPLIDERLMPPSKQ